MSNYKDLTKQELETEIRFLEDLKSKVDTEKEVKMLLEEIYEVNSLLKTKTKSKSNRLDS